MSLASEYKILLQCFIQKQLYLPSLIPSVPFRLFRSSALYSELNQSKICLNFNRFTEPLSLSCSSSYVSIWNENHLGFLKLINRTRSIQMEKIILKNPFKTQKLIKDCIDLGVNTMVVDNFEQLWKIHQCRLSQKNSSFQQIPINFIWMVSDPDNDIRDIQTLKSYKIKLGGLFFDQAQTSNIVKVKQLITKANDGISEKKRIRRVYLESEPEEFYKTQATYQNDDFFVKNKIETVLEKTNFKMNDKCWIAARVIGQSRRKELILGEEAYNYITVDQVKKGKVVQKEGKKWIFSSVSYFPETSVMEEHHQKGYIMDMN